MSSSVTITVNESLPLKTHILEENRVKKRGSYSTNLFAICNFSDWLNIGYQGYTEREHLTIALVKG